MAVNFSGQSPFAHDIAEFIQAVRDDQQLTQWLLGLESLSDPQRNRCVAIVLERMHAANERPELIRVVRALNRPEVLQAVAKTLREILLN